MLTIAVAALALSGSANLQTSTHILPLYDLVTAVDVSGNVTVNFMLNANWNPATNNVDNFKFFFANGNLSAFSPDGHWNMITPSAFAPISGKQVTINFNSLGPTPRGTIWIQYMGNSNDSVNGAEASIIATQVPPPAPQGHGGRPGHIVPIITTTPEAQNFNIPIQFDIATPYAGWGNSAPNFWMNTGNNNSPYPSNGWQNMGTSGINATNGTQVITTTGHPNSNAGYYCIGSLEAYTPYESYNNHNLLFPEFSAVIRAYTANQ